MNFAEWEKTNADAFDVTLPTELQSGNDATTALSVSETGWRTDIEGLCGSHEKGSGWRNTARCLKTQPEQGIDLR
jgi:hypothetical protein